jgi:molecular chaperone DnaK
MGYRLGIDLGTTFTAAATDVGGSPRMVGLGNRALQVPSVLYLKEDGTFLCGEAAERRAVEHPERVVREFKRRIGDTVPILVAGHPFSPQALTAKLLTWVVSTAGEREGEQPDEVILTHPANWGGFKRELFGQVASLADLSRVQTCAEPEAAAIQYSSRAHLEPGDRVVVYDLGGGTFDVCVLQMTEDGCAILGSPDGVEHLGGIDFDEAVFRHVLDALGEQVAGLDPGEPEVTSGLIRLRRDCVEAKEALSNDVDTVIPVHLPGISTSVRLTRSELEGLISPAITETLSAMKRALRSATTSAEDLAAVVLVGGSSRIPLISQRLQGELGVRTAMDTHPKHDIALGAVRHARRAPSADAAVSGQPAASRAVPAVAGWPTRDAGAPPTLAAASAVPSLPSTAPTSSPSPPTVEAATQPIPAVTTPLSRPPGRATGARGPVTPTARETKRPPAGTPPPSSGEAPPWRWIALAAGLFLVAGGAAVAATVGFGGGEEGPTGSGGSSEAVAISRDEVVVPLDVGQGVGLYTLAEGGTPEAVLEPDSGDALTVPSLSPDRRFLYFRVGSAEDLRTFTTQVLEVATGQVAPMVDEAEGLECVGRPAWQPGSSTVALLCRQGDRLYPFEGRQDGDGQISGLGRIPQLGTGWANVGYLGTGDLVVTQRSNGAEPGIHLGQPGELRWLVSGEVGDTASSPFGPRILYEQDGAIWLVRADGGALSCPAGEAVPDARTGTPRCRLTEVAGATADVKPTWEEAEDGTPDRFVFVRADDPDVVAGELLLLDLDGGDPRPFSDDVGDVSGQPAWAHR